MNDKKSIIILYSEIMGYTLAGLNELSEAEDILIYIVGTDKNKLTPFTFEVTNRINYIPYSTFNNSKELIAFCESVNPSVIFVNSWHIRNYMKVARYFFKRNITTVCVFDQQWLGTLKQWIGRLTSPIYLKRHFNCMWGSGPRQFEFARKMGFAKKDIYLGFYTCDFDLFSSVKNSWKKNILFVGRFVPVKGIDILIDSFNSVTKDFPGWTLTLVGSGNLTNNNPNIIIKEFKQPDDLVSEFSRASIFCLPSTFEPWGVVLHESVCAGLPIICSDSCGAGDVFVIDNYNGYIFENQNKEQLTQALRSLMSKDIEELSLWGQRSRLLSQNWIPKIWASTVVSILNKYYRK